MRVGDAVGERSVAAAVALRLFIVAVVGALIVVVAHERYATVDHLLP